MRLRPVVLGCDPGERNTAFGVVGHLGLLHSSLLDGQRLSWDGYCVHFHETIGELLRTYKVERMAIEDFRWHGEFAKVEPPIRELIGIARLFSQTIPVEVIEAKVWSQAITGSRPVKGYGFDRQGLWKQKIRLAVTQRLKLIGVDLDAVVGKDHGSHRTDAIAIALFAQDRAHVDAHARR